METTKEIGFDSEEIKEEKPRVLYIELYDRRPSGFVLDGTRGTENHQELDAPTARFIPNFGYRKGTKDEVVNGKKVKIAYNEPIRYIKEQTEISVIKQQLLGITRSRAGKEDLIEVKRGNFSVVREGSYIGLYDYLLEAFYNASNPHRSAGADKIYKVIEMGKEEEELNEYDIAMADALQFVARFYKKTKQGYQYNEEKINAMCELFTVFGETMAGKVTALNALAKADPAAFMKRAELFEQINVTHVTHALQLNVISFKGNVAEYVGKEKVIVNLGSEKLTHEQKIERLADFLQTPELRGAYEELQLEIEIAKENQLK